MENALFHDMTKNITIIPINLTSRSDSCSNTESSWQLPKTPFLSASRLHFIVRIEWSSSSNLTRKRTSNPSGGSRLFRLLSSWVVCKGLSWSLDSHSSCRTSVSRSWWWWKLTHLVFGSLWCQDISAEHDFHACLERVIKLTGLSP